MTETQHTMVPSAPLKRMNSKLEKIQFLRRHPVYAYYAIHAFYPLTGELLIRHRECLSWSAIAENEEIQWSPGLILAFLKYLKDDNGKLYWSLCYNAAVPWSVDFIAQFENLWHWDCLGANDQIYYDIAIQRAFRKYLEPVNIWLERESIDSEERQDDERLAEEPKPHVKDPVPLLDEPRWNFELLMNCETDVDFDALCCSRQAWVDCFGDLADDDVDTILGDKSIYESAVAHTRACQLAIEAAEGDTTAPECLTFEYFLKHRYNKQ